MSTSHKVERVRVLYSFPHRLGADRICYTAWQQVNGLASAGADLLVFPGAVSKPVPAGVRADPTLAWGKLRLPYRLLGSRRTFELHDAIVAQRLRKLGGQVDIVLRNCFSSTGSVIRQSTSAETICCSRLSPPVVKLFRS